MERPHLLTALDAAIDGFGRTCSAADLSASVPACPEWNVADLVWHVTEVHHFWRTMVAERLTDPGAYTRPLRPPDEALLEMYRVGGQRVLDTLRDTPDDTAVWTWSADRTVGFVLRRMTHETAAHLGDAQQAAGAEPTMDAALASDGVDEFLEHFAAGPREEPPLGGSVHLHCTDVAGEWLVVDGAGGSLAVTREHAKGDCAIRGAAVSMVFALWRRVPLNRLDVIGDADLAGRFIARTRLE